MLIEGGGQRRDRRRARDSARFKEQDWRGWYSLAIWRGKKGLRAQQLARQPLCERHLGRGQDVIADTVLHKLGKRLAVGTVLMYSDGEDMPCARASVTYAIPSSYRAS